MTIWLARRKEFDGLRAQVRDLLHRGEKSMLQLQDQQRQFEQRKSPADSPNGGEGQTEPVEPDPAKAAANAARIKKIAAWVEKMPAEQAANYIRKLSDDGKHETAVDVLVHIEERDVAKILAAMNSPDVVFDLTESFRKYKRSNVAGTVRFRR